MPKRRDELSQREVFPPDNLTGECNEWCAPLHQFHDRIRQHPHAVFFDVDDFMLMCGLQRPGHPLLILCKHRETRRYLNVDAAGDVWQYVAPRKFSDRTPGTYTRLASVEEALEGLGLEEMPWMDPDRFGHLQTEDAVLDDRWEDGYC